MSKLKFLFIILLFSGCATVDKVSVPQDCSVIRLDVHTVEVNCPKTIKVNETGKDEYEPARRG